MKKTNKSNTSGTYLQGYLYAQYAELVEVFGEPNDGPNDFGLDKTTCEWNLEYEDNKYCTIYDWKLPETPIKLYAWHIGGNELDCVDKVSQFFLRELLKK